MSCYFRHLKDIFAEAGIEVTRENRHRIDCAIHEAVGVEYEDCPAAWKRLKQEVLSNEARRRDLARKVREVAGTG